MEACGLVHFCHTFHTAAQNVCVTSTHCCVFCCTCIFIHSDTFVTRVHGSARDQVDILLLTMKHMGSSSMVTEATLMGDGCRKEVAEV